MSNTKNGLYPKIARIMGRLDRLPKTGWNKHFNYKFVTDADVADAVRKELAAENIAFFASMVDVHREGKHTVARFEFTFVCADTGESKMCKWAGEANDGQDKGVSKAATSAEKFFLLKTFMLSSGDAADDPDSDGRTGNGEQNTPPAPKTAPPRDDSGEEVSELDDITWTRDKQRLTNLRNKAASYWGTDADPMPYKRVYNRFALILELDLRPATFPAFADMMGIYCELTPEEIWKHVEDYVPQSE